MENLIKKSVARYALIGILFTACAPVNSTFESAKLIEKNQFEVMGAAEGYLGHDFKEKVSGVTNYNFGIRAGYGVSEKLNLRLRYTHLRVPRSENINFGAHHLSLSPKIRLIKDRLAFIAPIGKYFVFSEESCGVWSFAPKLVYTLPLKENLDLTLVGKTEVLLQQDVLNNFYGLNIGCGFLTKSNKIRIQPEFGLQMQEWGILNMNFGIGVTRIFGK